MNIRTASQIVAGTILGAGLFYLCGCATNGNGTAGGPTTLPPPSTGLQTAIGGAIAAIPNPLVSGIVGALATYIGQIIWPNSPLVHSSVIAANQPDPTPATGAPTPAKS